jgi:hypothetical protein
VLLRTPTVLVALAVAGVLGLAACPAEETAAPEDGPDPTPAAEPATPPPDEPDEPDEPEEPREPHRAADLPGPRTEVTGTAWNGRIIAVGGLDDTGSAMSNVDIYDPETDTWTSGPALPVGLHHTAVATLDGRVYVVGG